MEGDWDAYGAGCPVPAFRGAGRPRLRGAVRAFAVAGSGRTMLLRSLFVCPAGHGHTSAKHRTYGAIPVTPAPGTPAATTFSPSPHHVLEQQTETVPAPATTAAVPPAPAATPSPTSSQTTGPAVVGSGPDSLGPSGPVASPSPLAGILLAVGGCLIAAGGALGLRRFPRW